MVLERLDKGLASEGAPRIGGFANLGKVVVGTTEETVKVPDVDVEVDTREAEVKVPTIGVVPPEDKE